MTALPRTSTQQDGTFKLSGFTVLMMINVSEDQPVASIKLYPLFCFLNESVTSRYVSPPANGVPSALKYALPVMNIPLLIHRRHARITYSIISESTK